MHFLASRIAASFLVATLGPGEYFQLLYNYRQQINGILFELRSLLNNEWGGAESNIS